MEISNLYTEILTFCADNRALSHHLSVPAGIEVVRFCLNMNEFCIIKNLEMISNIGHINYINDNGKTISEYDVFLSKNPQFLIPVSEGIDSITVSADVSLYSSSKIVGLTLRAVENIKTLESEVKTLKENIESLESKVKSKALHIDKMRNEFNSKYNQLYNELTKDIESKNRDIQMHSLIIESITNAIDKNNVELQDLRHHYSEIINQRNALSETCDELRTHYDAAINQRNVLSETCDELRTHYDAAINQRNALSETCDELRTHYVAAINQRDDALAELAKMKQSTFWRITKPARFIVKIAKSTIGKSMSST